MEINQVNTQQNKNENQNHKAHTLAQYASAATWHVFCMVKAFRFIIWDTRKEYWLKLIVISLKAGAICSCNISFTLSIKTGARPFEKFFKCHLWIVDKHTSTVKVEPIQIGSKCTNWRNIRNASKWCHCSQNYKSNTMNVYRCKNSRPPLCMSATCLRRFSLYIHREWQSESTNMWYNTDENGPNLLANTI